MLAPAENEIPYTALRGLPLGQPPSLAFLALAARLAGLLDLPPSLPICAKYSRTAGGAFGLVFMVLSVCGDELPAPSGGRRGPILRCSVFALQHDRDDWRGIVTRPADAFQVNARLAPVAVCIHQHPEFHAVG